MGRLRTGDLLDPLLDELDLERFRLRMGERERDLRGEAARREGGEERRGGDPLRTGGDALRGGGDALRAGGEARRGEPLLTGEVPEHLRGGGDLEEEERGRLLVLRAGGEGERREGRGDNGRRRKGERDRRRGGDRRIHGLRIGDRRRSLDTRRTGLGECLTMNRALTTFPSI